jgi:hypothetical protein
MARTTVPPPADAPTTSARWCCPLCGAPMVIGPNLIARQLAGQRTVFDTS